MKTLTLLSYLLLVASLVSYEEAADLGEEFELLDPRSFSLKPGQMTLTFNGKKYGNITVNFSRVDGLFTGDWKLNIDNVPQVQRRRKFVFGKLASPDSYAVYFDELGGKKMGFFQISDEIQYILEPWYHHSETNFSTTPTVGTLVLYPARKEDPKITREASIDRIIVSKSVYDKDRNTALVKLVADHTLFNSPIARGDPMNVLDYIALVMAVVQAQLQQSEPVFVIMKIATVDIFTKPTMEFFNMPTMKSRTISDHLFDAQFNVGKHHSAGFLFTYRKYADLDPIVGTSYIGTICSEEKNVAVVKLQEPLDKKGLLTLETNIASSSYAMALLLGAGSMDDDFALCDPQPTSLNHLLPCNLIEIGRTLLKGGSACFLSPKSIAESLLPKSIAESLLPKSIAESKSIAENSNCQNCQLEPELADKIRKKFRWLRDTIVWLSCLGIITYLVAIRSLCDGICLLSWLILVLGALYLWKIIEVIMYT